MTARQNWAAYHQKNRAKKAARGKCKWCDNNALPGSLCDDCAAMSHRRHRERRALFHRMRAFVVELAATGNEAARALLADLPTARPRRAGGES